MIYDKNCHMHPLPEKFFDLYFRMHIRSRLRIEGIFNGYYFDYAQLIGESEDIVYAVAHKKMLPTKRILDDMGLTEDAAEHEEYVKKIVVNVVRSKRYI